MRKRVLSLVVVFALVLSSINILAAGSSDTVIFNDSKLESILKEKLCTTDSILKTQLENLDGELDLSGSGITDITGLEWCKNIDSIDLRDNNISNVDALSSLTNVKQLYLSNNTNLTDITPLSGLVSMLNLDIANTGVTSLNSLSSMTLLRTLDIHSLRSVDSLSSLSGLTKLESLDASYTTIADKDLKYLKDMSKLKILNLAMSNDTYSKKPLYNHGFLPSSLEYLSVRGNDLSESNFVYSLPNLKELDMSINNISNITYLSELTQLTRLNIAGNCITDLTPIQNLNLTTLVSHLNFIDCFSSGVNKDIADKFNTKTTTSFESNMLNTSVNYDNFYQAKLTGATDLKVEKGKITSIGYKVAGKNDRTEYDTVEQYYAGWAPVIMDCVSSDPSVATVDYDGNVTGVGEGRAVITGKIQGIDSPFTTFQTNVEVTTSVVPDFGKAVIKFVDSSNGQVIKEDDLGSFDLHKGEELNLTHVDNCFYSSGTQSIQSYTKYGYAEKSSLVPIGYDVDYVNVKINGNKISYWKPLTSLFQNFPKTPPITSTMCDKVGKTTIYDNYLAFNTSNYNYVIEVPVIKDKGKIHIVAKDSMTWEELDRQEMTDLMYNVKYTIDAPVLEGKTLITTPSTKEVILSIDSPEKTIEYLYKTPAGSIRVNYLDENGNQIYITRTYGTRQYSFPMIDSYTKSLGTYTIKPNSVQDYTLDDVSSKEVTISQDGQAVTISFKFKSNKQTPPPVTTDSVINISNNTTSNIE